MVDVWWLIDGPSRNVVTMGDISSMIDVVHLENVVGMGGA